MLKRTEGIVIKNKPMREADLIVTYLTRDYGIMNLYAKSPRKVGSRFGSSLEPVTYSRIGFFGKEQTGLPRLTQSDIIKPHHGLRDSIKIFIPLSEMLELSLRLLPERADSRAAFSLLLNSLSAIEKEPDNPLHAIYYKIRLLQITGFAPKLHLCGRCGGDADLFFLSEGAVLCSRCRPGPGRHMLISPPMKKVYHYLSRVRASTIGRLKLGTDVIHGLEALMDSHINYTVVDNLKTKTFMQVTADEG